MRKFYLILFIFLPALTLAVPVKRDWKLAGEHNKVFSWRLKSNPKVKAIYQSRTPLKNADLEAVGSEKFFKKWEEPKKKVMQAMGITNWRADDYDWTKKRKYQKLVVDGSYTSRQKKPVFFREVHFYSANQTLQLLFTSPQKSHLNQSAVDNFIENAKKDVLKGV